MDSGFRRNDGFMVNRINCLRNDTRTRSEAQALALKTNPPYPPLSGGQKNKNPLPVASAAFSYPPDKGG